MKIQGKKILLMNDEREAMETLAERMTEEYKEIMERGYIDNGIPRHEQCDIEADVLEILSTTYNDSLFHIIRTIQDDNTKKALENRFTDYEPDTGFINGDLLTDLNDFLGEYDNTGSPEALNAITKETLESALYQQAQNKADTHISKKF